MELAYRIKLTNRYFGAPCEDIVDDLGLVWFAPFNMEKIREAVQVMGFTPKPGADSVEIDDDLEMAAIEIEPTRYGADSAWIDLWR